MNGDIFFPSFFVPIIFFINGPVAFVGWPIGTANERRFELRHVLKSG